MTTPESQSQITTAALRAELRRLIIEARVEMDLLCRQEDEEDEAGNPIAATRKRVQADECSRRIDAFARALEVL